MQSQNPDEDREVQGQLDLLNEIPGETRGTVPSEEESDEDERQGR